MARLSLFRALVPTPRRLLAAVTLACIVAMTPSCFITSTPDFKPPPQTPPFLLGETASPTLGEIVTFHPGDTINVSAGLRSEDDLSQVDVRLYVDYGRNTTPGQPYFGIPVQGTPVAPSTMLDTIPRHASVVWTPSPGSLSPGCHRITLMVSHAFATSFITTGEVTCPANLSDSDALSWDFLVCSDTMCPPLDPAACQPMDHEVDCPAQWPPPTMTTSSSTGSAG